MAGALLQFQHLCSQIRLNSVWTSVPLKKAMFFDEID
jgi:hypothetical protein